MNFPSLFVFCQDIRSTHLFDELGGHVAHHGEEVEAQEACNRGEVLGWDEEVVTRHAHAGRDGREAGEGDEEGEPYAQILHPAL